MPDYGFSRAITWFKATAKKPLGIAPNIKKVSASEGAHVKTGNPLLLDQRDWTIREVEVVDRNVDYDLALLEAIVDRNKYDSLQPIPFISDCGTSLYSDQETVPDRLSQYRNEKPHCTGRPASSRRKSR